MSFKTVEAVLGSAVVSGGTFTLSYPANTGAGTFASYGHKLWVDGFQRLLASPADFTLSFGASNITVTHNGSTSIPAGTRVNAQLNIEGADSGEIVKSISENDIRRTFLHNIAEINLGSPVAADADGYVVSQDLTAAGVFSTNTTVAAALAAAALKGVADVPRNVVAAWTGTAVLTVTGKDEYGNTVVESSASGTSLAGKKAFKSITNITSSANITSLTVGTGDVLGLPFFVGNKAQVMAEFKGGVQQAGPSPAGSTVRVPFQIDETDLLAGTPISVLCPVAGVIARVKTIVWKAVGTGGDLTMKVNNTAVDGLTVTVADSSSAGDVDSDVPTTGHASTVVAVGDELEIIPAAAFATTGAVTGYIEIEPSDVLNGTLVVGSTSKPTATTGDVRGTYDPLAACDGATSFDLLVRSADLKYKGLTPYAG